MITGKSRILPTLGFPKPPSTLLLSAKSRKYPRRSQVSANQPSFFLLFLGPRHSPRNGESVRQRTPAPQSRTLFSPSLFPRTWLPRSPTTPPSTRPRPRRLPLKLLYSTRPRIIFYSGYSSAASLLLAAVGRAVEWGSVRTFFLSLVRKHWVS